MDFTYKKRGEGISSAEAMADRKKLFDLTTEESVRWWVGYRKYFFGVLNRALGPREANI